MQNKVHILIIQLLLMAEPFSPNIFLFQSYVGEVLKDCKKQIKTGPFENLDPEQIFNQHKNQHIDAFHQYFLSAMSYSSKTREIACTNYQKLIRQGLVDKEHIPPSLISSVLTACASTGLGGGSTSGSSSLGSTSLNAASQGHALHIGTMIKTMLLNTFQTSGELSQGLNYLLEGTRKKNVVLYNAMISEVYQELLVKYREPPLKVFTQNYLDMLVDEIEVKVDNEEKLLASRKIDEKSGKVEMAIFHEESGLGKFGRCFYCRKQASHYLKEEWLPICSLGCRQKVKTQLTQCQNTQPFHLFNWLLDNLPSGDEVLLNILNRELEYAQNKQILHVNQILTILKILIHQVGTGTMYQPLINTVTLLMVKWRTLIPAEEISQELEQKMERYLRVYLLEVLNIVEQLPISKKYIHYINLLSEVLNHDDILVNLFLKYDSKFFQTPILARMLNLISQYSKRYDSQLQGLVSIVRTLMDKFIVNNVRNDHWKGYAQFKKKMKVREIITAFNKKPKNGMKMLENLFKKEGEEEVSLSQSQISEKQNERPEIVRREEQRADNRSIQTPKSDSFNDESIEEQDKGRMQEEPRYDSDRVIKKRMGEFEEEHPSFHQIGNSDDFQLEESREEVQVNEPRSMKKIQSSPAQIQHLPSIDEETLNHVLESKGISKKNEKIQEQKPSSLSHIKQSNLTPFEIALFILKNIELKSWTQADSKLPIPISMLSKTMVGQFLGADSELVRSISREILNKYEYDDLQLDDIMRIVMNIYNLPKETQQIERILEDISLKVNQRFKLADSLPVYQYIYLLLMVQTSLHNPQVRQSEKITLAAYLSMGKGIAIDISEEKMQENYRRIATNSLNNKLKYPQESIFYKKYPEGLAMREELLDEEEGNLSQSILLYLWQYFVIGLVIPGNRSGLFEATILYGRQELEDEQKGFFQALRKSAPDQNKQLLLKIAIEYGNDLVGKPWAAIVSLLYSLDQSNDDISGILDKLFTNSADISPPRMRDFLQALLQFSSSEFRKDANYTRELFVLSNINSLIGYNVDRFNALAPLCWGLLRDYFKDICLHPRRDISMPAVDCLKQFSMKLINQKIDAVHQNGVRHDAVPHDALLSTFFYVFERSGTEMKDLVANVLQNLITENLRGGWDSIYNILDVLDTKDKELVVKLIGRLVGQVGLDRLGNLPRLHTICIKELRVCTEPKVIEKLLSQLWQLSSFIDESNIWLQTIGSIKDIFKISLNPEIMNIFVKLSNRCIAGVQVQREEGPKLLDKEVLEEVINVLMFLLDLKGRSKTPALIASLDAIADLDIGFIIKNLNGSCGLLEIFRLFLSGEQKVTFTIFFKSFIKDTLLPHLYRGENEVHIQNISYWCVNEYLNHIPAELFNLKGKDKDFQQTLTGYLNEEGNQVQKNSVLIEFHLSHKDNFEKSFVHLVFLDIVEAIYVKLNEFQRSRMEILFGKIEEAMLESFDCACKFNKLILLRNFLWNNGFLTGKALPGLLKQEHRTLLAIVRNFPLQKIYDKIIMYLNKFRETVKNLDTLKALNDPNRLDVKRRKNSRHEEDKKDENKGLSVYSSDASLWITEAQEGISLILATIREELVAPKSFNFSSQEIEKLIAHILSVFELRSLAQNVKKPYSEVLQTLYDLTL